MNSYWIDSIQSLSKNNPIDNDYTADVCVIGAGITGLSTGYYLSKNGLKVIIIDKNEIGEKTSGHTTAKITFQHNLIYDYLINSYGEEFALGYLQANENAISNIREIIKEENIECDIEKQHNFVYTTDTNEVKKIQNEVNAINKLKRRKFCRICS